MKQNINLALNPFKKGKKTEVEGIHKVEVVKKTKENSVNLETAIKQFHEWYEITVDANNFRREHIYPNVEDYALLSPNQIYFFLEEISDFSKNRFTIEGDYADSLYCSDHINKLIQKSYNAGYNDFILSPHPNKSIIFGLAHELKGKKERPLNLRINGFVWEKFAHGSEYVNYFISDGAAKMCGSGSTKCNFFIHNYVSNGCGYSAKDSKFTIHHDVFSFGNHSENCEFIIFGNAKTFNLASKNCTYKFLDKELFDRCTKHALNNPDYNLKTYLIDKNGDIIE